MITVSVYARDGRLMVTRLVRGAEVARMRGMWAVMYPGCKVEVMNTAVTI